jgi:hypothetical protein
MSRLAMTAAAPTPTTVGAATLAAFLATSQAIRALTIKSAAERARFAVSTARCILDRLRRMVRRAMPRALPGPDRPKRSSARRQAGVTTPRNQSAV